MDFAKHDIVFEFMDYRGTISELRCCAEPFLTSPWPGTIDGTTLSQFECTADEQEERLCDEWILGMVSSTCHTLRIL